MIAATVGDIRRALRQRQFQAHTAALASLNDGDAAAVGRALLQVKRKTARVDLGRLIEEVRREREQAEAAARANCRPWRYALTLMDPDQLAAFKALLEAGVGPNEAASRAMTEARARSPARRSVPRVPFRRRSVQRIPSKRAQQMQPVDRARPIAHEPMLLPAAKVFGSSLDDHRPFGCPEGVSYDAWSNPARPPWLLDDGDDGDDGGHAHAALQIDDECDDELDDD